MTVLQQGHFFQPINHTLDISAAITFSWFDSKGFSCRASLPPPLSALFLLNFKSPPASPWRIFALIVQKSEIILDPVDAAGGSLSF